MDLAPTFLGTLSLSIVLLTLEGYKKREPKPAVKEGDPPKLGEAFIEWTPLFLFGLATLFALYPVIASSLTPDDSAHARIDDETVVAVSMISQFFIIGGFCVRLWAQNKIVGLLIGVMFLVGIPTVIYSF